MPKGATITSIDELDKLRYPLPKSWIRTAGIWKNKKIDPIKYQKQVRREWEVRLKKLEKQFNESKQNKTRRRR